MSEGCYAQCCMLRDMPERQFTYKGTLIVTVLTLVLFLDFFYMCDKCLLDTMNAQSWCNYLWTYLINVYLPIRFRKTNRQVSGFRCYTATHKCGNQRWRKGCSISCAIYCSTWGEISLALIVIVIGLLLIWNTFRCQYSTARWPKSTTRKSNKCVTSSYSALPGSCDD